MAYGAGLGVLTPPYHLEDLASRTAAFTTKFKSTPPSTAQSHCVQQLELLSNLAQGNSGSAEWAVLAQQLDSLVTKFTPSLPFSKISETPPITGNTYQPPPRSVPTQPPPKKCKRKPPSKQSQGLYSRICIKSFTFLLLLFPITFLLAQGYTP